MFVQFGTDLPVFVTDRTAVDTFKSRVGFPSATFHKIDIWDSDGMSNRYAIGTEIMKTEVRQTCTVTSNCEFP